MPLPVVAIFVAVLQAAPERATVLPPCSPPYIDQHVIYFPPGSATLDLNRAWRVKTASDYIEHGVSRVRVHGYTDTVGSLESNRALSRARARAVVAELVRLGVPGSTIEVIEHGEVSPPRPTADETPEPLNRVVRIDYRGGRIPALERLRESYCPVGR